MPEYLRSFLELLPDYRADELWLYFDSCDNMDLIEVIADSHPALKAKHEQEIEGQF